MASDHVSTLRAVYERWARGDMRAGVELFDPHVTFVLSPEFPEAGVYIGPAEVARYMRGFLEPWVRLTISAEDFWAAGDSVAVQVRQHGEGGGSGAAAELRYFQVWTFRGDRVVRFESIRDRDTALAAIGLPPSENADELMGL